MRYSPQPGDIGLTQIKGRVGRGIQIAQGLNGTGFDDVEHAFTVIGSLGTTTYDFGTWIVEAEPGPLGAQKNELSKYDGFEVYYIRCPDEYRETMVAAAMRCIGVQYAFADYAALTLHHFHIPAPGLREYIKDSRHMICSQMADWQAVQSGWHLFDDGRWEGYVTPGHLYDYYGKQPYASHFEL